MSLSISLAKEAFRPGECVQGQVILATPISIEISGIYLQLQGIERVRFRASVRNDLNGSSEDVSKGFDSPLPSRRHSKRHAASATHQQTINTGIPTRLPITQPHFLQSLLLTVTIPVTRFRGSLAAGTHSFPFSVNLPSRLPPTIHFSSGNKYLAEVAYEFTVQVFRPHNSLAQSLNWTSPLPVLPAKTAKSPVYLNSFLERSVKSRHTLCCFPAKQIDFHAAWRDSIVSPGQEMEITAQIKSSSSTPPSRVSVKLVQELLLNISGHYFRHVSPISKSKFPKDFTFDSGASVSLQVPPGLAPSTQTEAIECKYFLVFEIDWRWAETALLASEITIRSEANANQ